MPRKRLGKGGRVCAAGTVLLDSPSADVVPHRIIRAFPELLEP